MDYKNLRLLPPEDMREYWRLHRLAFPEKWRAWRQRGKDKQRLRSKRWQQANLEYFRKYSKEYRAKDPEKFRKIDRKRQPAKTIYTRNKRRNDLSFRLAGQLRSRMNAALRGKNKAFGTLGILGCSLEDFKIYLESKFEPGMSWANYSRTGWHIDHIVPCAIFDLTKAEHQKVCFHFSNMQPMWATKNLSKNRYPKDNQLRLI